MGSGINQVALEVHERTAIWNPHKMLDILDFMRDHGFTALVLHQVGLGNEIVYPSIYLGGPRSAANIYERHKPIYRILWKEMPLARDTRGTTSSPYHRLEYLRALVAEANKRGINVYINDKEIDFLFFILERNPGLVKKGDANLAICPSEKFWAKYLTNKYSELCEELPTLKGFIVSLGTRESRLSVAYNRCECNTCRTLQAQEWYGQMIQSIYAATERYGKELIVRDFAYTKKEQDSLACTISELPNDIIVSVKNTPHDYYPTFPNNRMLEILGGRSVWIEFDAMGQFYGWGIAPCVLFHDFGSRLDHARKVSNLEGVLIRVDWECLPSHTAFDTLNILNLYCISEWMQSGEIKPQKVCARWLGEKGYAQGGKAQDLGTQLAEILEMTWPIVKSSLYANSCVINDSSKFPYTVDLPFFIGEELHSLKEWDESKSTALSVDPENVARLLSEKDEALALLNKANAWVREKGSSAFPVKLRKELHKWFSVFDLYITGFQRAFTCSVLSRHLMQYKNEAASYYLKELRTATESLRGYVEALRRVETSLAEHPLYMLLDTRRLESLYNDVSECLRMSRA